MFPWLKTARCLVLGFSWLFFFASFLGWIRRLGVAEESGLQESVFIWARATCALVFLGIAMITIFHRDELQKKGAFLRSVVSALAGGMSMMVIVFALLQTIQVGFVGSAFSLVLPFVAKSGIFVFLLFSTLTMFWFSVFLGKNTADTRV